MEIQNSSRSGKLVSRLAVMLLVAALGACGGGGGEPFGGGGGGTPTPDDGGGGGGSPTPDPDADPEAPDRVATASIMPGTVTGESAVRVLNAAFSVRDADGQPIEYLHGGDFEVKSTTTNEGFHDARRLAYPSQLKGRIHLMLDVSNSMAARYSPFSFEDYTDEAARFVTEMAAYGLDVAVYKFSDEQTPTAAEPDPTLLGSVLGGGDATPVANAVKALTVDSPGSTRFYKIVSNTIKKLVTASWNGIVLDHNLSNPPDVKVELMVIMSDGRDTSGDGSFGEINTAKDARFSVMSIAIGDDPDEGGLDGISEFFHAVPEDGDYSDAVNAAIEDIKTYYASFYLVDYMPPDLEKPGDETYKINLVGNNNATLNVTYKRENYYTKPSVVPVCCKLRVNPSVDLSTPVVIAPGETVELTAVKLWTHEQPVFTWTFTSDGNTTIDPSAISTAVITSNQNSSDATVKVEAVSEGWSPPNVTIQVRP